MKNFVFIFAFAIFCIIQIEFCHAANIVFFFALSSYSHRIAVWPLVEKLADIGHNVTFFQPHKPKHPHPKVQEMFPTEVQNLMDMKLNGDVMLPARLKNGRLGTLKEVTALPQISLKICETYLSSPEVINWLNFTKIDLIYIDALFNECGFGLAHKTGAKLGIISTTSVRSWWHDELGFPAETSWLPELYLSFQHPMNFIERTITTLHTLGIYFYRTWIYLPRLENILREKLQIPNMPPISEMMKDVGVVLLNSHFSEEFARSLPPLVIPVGGMHLETQGNKIRNEIPKEIETFINVAGENGFIYVSFGSAANIATAPEELRNLFYTAFSNSKTQFIWKWNGPRPKEMPPNVFTAEWLPQQGLLSHPKLKAFISHGGLLSIQEAISFEVPMIVFPLFAEQDYNAFRVERMGRGIRLEIESLTLPILQNAISEILNNTNYKKAMVKTAQLFNDRQVKPLDTAVWWTEYILRHDDTLHLMPLGVNQNWYQRRLLDVWLFVAIVVVSAALIAIFVLRKLLAVLFPIILSTEHAQQNSECQNQSTKNGIKFKKA